MVTIVPDLCRQIEGHTQPVYTLRQQIMVSFIAFFGCTETRVLAHCPQFTPVHIRLYAAGIRKNTGRRICRSARKISSCVNFFYADTGVGVSLGAHDCLFMNSSRPLFIGY
jgi:hypothetical protein